MDIFGGRSKYQIEKDSFIHEMSVRSTANLLRWYDMTIRFSHNNHSNIKKKLFSINDEAMKQ